MRKFRNLLIGLAFIALPIFVYSGTDVHTLKVDGNQVWNIDNTGSVAAAGSIKLGDNNSTPTLPTATNAANFSLKIPYQNGSGSTITDGSVVVASTTASSLYIGSSVILAATTTVMGIADGDLASGANGYMSVAGYALVLTTGTIVVGDILVSTDGASGLATGFAGANNASTIAPGAVIGKAVEATTATGLTAVKLSF